MQIWFLSIFSSVAACHHHLSNAQTGTPSKGPNFQLRWLVLVSCVPMGSPSYAHPIMTLLSTSTTTKTINWNTTTIKHTLSSWLHFVVWIKFTPKINEENEKLKFAFSDGLLQVHVILSLPLHFVSWSWKVSPEGEVSSYQTFLWMGKPNNNVYWLDAPNFLHLCNDCKQTWRMPASVHTTVSVVNTVHE